MPPPKAHPAQLGYVANNQGNYRAQVNARDVGFAKLITGPYHGTKQRAFEDLQSIQAAAVEHTTRIGALQAMQQKADRLKAEGKAEVGRVELCGNENRAHFRYIQGGVQRDIRGPRRHDERRAQADIEVIRAAAAGKPTRAEQLAAMHAEARST